MTTKDQRQMIPLRLWPDIHEKIKAKVVQDKLSIQKLGEILFTAYIKGNKEINRLVQQNADEKHAKRRRYSLSESEADEFLRRVELENISPLQQFNELFDEIILDEDEGDFDE